MHKLLRSPLVLWSSLCLALFLFPLLWSAAPLHSRSSCGTSCTRRVLSRAKKELLGLSKNASLADVLDVFAVAVPATRPYWLASCKHCGCDVCDFMASTGVFAPVEAAAFDYILASADCDGNKAVVDVGANVGSFTMLAAAYECVPKVVAFEPNPAPRALAKASVDLNAASRRVTLLPYAVGDAHGTATLDSAADHRWGLAAVRVSPPDEQARLAARGVGDRHSLDEESLDQDEAAPVDAGASGGAGSGDDAPVVVVPLSDVSELTKDLLLLKIDTEGAEASVLPGTWALFDADRVVDNVLVEVKKWNTRPKRDLLRHLARTGGLMHVYTYKELYGPEGRVSGAGHVSLEGRFVDVSEIVVKGQYERSLPNEDFWFRRKPLPADMVAAAL